jgi:hypothetical protein
MRTKLPRGVAAVAVACAALALLPGCAQKGNPLEPGVDPGGYRIVGSLAISGYAEDVEVTGDLCLIAASQGGLVLVDVSDPAGPVYLSAGMTGYPVPGCSYVASDSLAFAASGAQGIYVFDVSDRLNPVLMSNGQGVFTRDVITREGTPGVEHEVLTADGYGVRTQRCYYYEPLGQWFFAQGDDEGGAGVSRGIGANGNYALIAREELGLAIYDATDYTDVVLVGSVDTPGEARAVAAAGDYAYVADWRKGLQVIDMSDPSNPVIVGSAEMDGMADGIAYRDGQVFVAAHTGGMYVFDVSNPADPVVAGHLETPYANAVFTTDTHIYIADRDWGLIVAEED